MIKEHKMYSVICDRCQINAFENDENIAWESEGSAWEMAYASGWQKIKDRHYCPGCYEINDEDQLVVKGGCRIYFEHKPKPTHGKDNIWSRKSKV